METTKVSAHVYTSNEGLVYVYAVGNPFAFENNTIHQVTLPDGSHPYAFTYDFDAEQIDDLPEIEVVVEYEETVNA